MTKQELELKRAELFKQIDEVTAEIERSSKVELWDPSRHESYYIINTGGHVFKPSGYDKDSDARSISNGNCFRDIDTAQYYATKRAARNRLEMLALEVEGKPYEFRLDHDNWIIEYDGFDGDIKVTVTDMYNTGSTAFSSQENAQRVLDSLSAEDKRILWGVE